MSDHFENRLDNIESKLDNVSDAITRIAVQKQRIDTLEFKIGSLWQKWDKLIDPDQGILLKIQNKMVTYDTQAKTIKWVMILFSTTVLGCTASLFAMANYLLKISPIAP